MCAVIGAYNRRAASARTLAQIGIFASPRTSSAYRKQLSDAAASEFNRDALPFLQRYVQAGIATHLRQVLPW